MRVTHIITRLIVGGAQENTIASVLGLRNRFDFEVYLISGITAGPEGTLEPSVARVPGVLTTVPSLVRRIAPWQDCQALQTLTRILRRQQPQIVHTHSGKAGILGRLAARQARIPVIIHTIHGPSFGPFQGTLPNLAFRSAERLAARFTTHFVSVAQAMTDQYLAAGIGRPEQFTRIFSGFDLDPFLRLNQEPAFRKQLGIEPDDLVIGKVARLFELKGHEDLFDIGPDLVRRFPNLKFLLVGDGAWRPRFERQVADLNLQKQVIFAGLVPPADIPKFFGAMDIVVHLSRREGLPRALPQALAAARPIVAYNCDGAAEVCRDRLTGLLVPAGNRALLKERLEELLVNGDLRRELGRNGRELVRTSFSVDRMVTELHELYLELHSRAFPI